MQHIQSTVFWRVLPGVCFGMLLALFIVFGTGCSDDDDDNDSGSALDDAPAPTDVSTNAGGMTNSMVDAEGPPTAPVPTDSAALPAPLEGVVMVVGDSITVGFGEENWVSKLFRIVPRNYAGVAVNGLRADQAANRFEGNWRDKRPELVLLLIGTNDALAGRPARALEGIESIVAQSRAFGSDIIIGTIPPLTGRRASENRFAVEINNGIRALASANGIRVAEVDTLFGPGGPRSGSARISAKILPPPRDDAPIKPPEDGETPAEEPPGTIDPGTFPGGGGSTDPDPGGSTPTPDPGIPSTPGTGESDPPPAEEPPAPEPESEPEAGAPPLMSEAFLQSDGIHPNNAGQELIASAFAAQL